MPEKYQLLMLSIVARSIGINDAFIFRAGDVGIIEYINSLLSARQTQNISLFCCLERHHRDNLHAELQPSHSHDFLSSIRNFHSVDFHRLG